MGKIYYYSQYYSFVSNASVKPRTDFERVLKRYEAIPIGWPSMNLSNKILGKAYNFSNRILSKKLMPKNKTVVFQFPYQYYIREMVEQAKRKQNEVIMLIHDLDIIRNPECDGKIDVLEMADKLIVHTPAMADWIRQNTNFKGEIAILGPFDYMMDKTTNTPPRSQHKDNQEVKIAFCGNLAKSEFLDKLELPEGYKLVVYGNGCSEKLKSKPWIDYRGAVTPEELPALIAECDYGLVWDGTSCDLCDGPLGNYLRYNSPHKFSLYIVSGLPVIIWDEMGLAPFVKEHNIGICVNNLKEIPDKIKEISAEEKKEIKQNVEDLKQRLSQGQNYKDALEKLIASPPE